MKAYNFFVAFLSGLAAAKPLVSTETDKLVPRCRAAGVSATWNPPHPPTSRDQKLIRPY